MKLVLRKSLFIKSELREIGRKAIEAELAHFKRLILEHLEQQEDDLAKGGYAIGTIRDWQGKKYRKIGPGKWRRQFDGEGRGTEQAKRVLTGKVKAAQSLHELAELVGENRRRFSDAEGNPLPFVKELFEAAKVERATKQWGRKAPQAGAANGGNGGDGGDGEQLAAVRKRYEGTAQWMKAPNGKPTNLTEKQWLQVRTPNFKAWFGDWEALARYTMPRTAKSVDEAIKTLKDEGLVGKPFTNTKLGMTGEISGKSLKEFRIIKNSENSFAHAHAVANIDKLFENAEFESTHTDYHDNPQVEKIHRLGTVMMFEGEAVPVKITVKEMKPGQGAKHKIYTVEAIEIDKKTNSAGPPTDTPKEGLVPIAEFDSNLAQFTNSVKAISDKASKIVDESGEPLPVSISTDIPELFSQGTRGAEALPLEFATEIAKWETINKSPYSMSFYNKEGKTWDNTPDGIIRISDHWNFESRGKIHEITDKPVPNNTHYTMAVYHNGIYHVLKTIPARDWNDARKSSRQIFEAIEERDKKIGR